MSGGLLWIPTALSTLKPATSPHLSTIQLGFSSPLADRSVEVMIEEVGNDLRRIADEATRIECEFGGAAEFSLHHDREFELIFETLNVRFHFRVCGVNDASRSYRLTLTRPPQIFQCWDC